MSDTRPHRALRGVPLDVVLDLERAGCPDCAGGGCSRCDYTGFRANQRNFDTGYGWRRLVFWPWHYIQHVRRGRWNGYYSRLFCTWCVDNRMRDWSKEPTR